MSLINRLREKVNLKIFSSKGTVLKIIRVQSVFIALLGIALLVYVFGFPQTDETREIEILFLKFIFGFYLLTYLVRLFYTFEPAKFIRRTWLELLLLTLIIIESLSDLILGQPLVFHMVKSIRQEEYIFWYMYILQVLLIIFLIIDIAKLGLLLDYLKISAPGLFILSFLILIGSGAFLLSLPEMTTDGMGAPWLTALFTSTTASCVTGLVVVDPGTFFTAKGQVVIMLLIQFGGLNILSFATFFASFYSRGMGLKHRSMIQDYFSSDMLTDARSLLRQVVLTTLVIESLGAFAIFSLWNPEIPWKSLSEKIFVSIFHAISCFNNAGISTFTDGMYNPLNQHSFILHLAMTVIIFMGSLGFYPIQDIFGIENMRQRMRLPWKGLKISTRVCLYMALFLSIGGALGFYLLESDNTILTDKPFERIITSLFQSVSSRTTGLNSIDFGMAHNSTLLLIIFLMFVGASPGSTGGGIKTTTFTLIMLSAYSTVRGKRNIELFKRTISWELLNKAFSIFLFFISCIFLGTFLLSITDPQFRVIQLLFEQVSAMCTVGMSTGITPDLSNAGKLIIICTMFIGRIGPLTLAFALSKKVKTVNYRYPETHFMVG
ncbi:MAG: ATPase [Bacteroidia bacterium]|nr:ATPase [Bacteroidia bacterium]MCZ2276455.1 ATPase [Bacteroidia bacterium]